MFITIEILMTFPRKDLIDRKQTPVKGVFRVKEV